MSGSRVVHLVGPGGAGKTTIGSPLASRLGLQFIDLDAEFTARFGDISAYLDTYGYQAYAAENVALYIDLVAAAVPPGVAALSSGFMTYSQEIHPDYASLRQRIGSSPSTFVLLPSLVLEECVHETVRRQVQRPFARSAEREEQVIRERFFIHVDLAARKVETARPMEAILAALIAALPQRGSQIVQKG